MRRIFKKDRTLVTHILYFHSVVTISIAPSGQSPIAALTNHHHLRFTILEVRSPKLVPPIQLMCGVGSFLSMHIGFLAVRRTLVPCPCCLPAEGHSSCWRPLHSFAMAPDSKASSAVQVSLKSSSLLPLLATLTQPGKNLCCQDP